MKNARIGFYRRFTSTNNYYLVFSVLGFLDYYATMDTSMFAPFWTRNNGFDVVEPEPMVFVSWLQKSGVNVGLPK